MENRTLEHGNEVFQSPEFRTNQTLVNQRRRWDNNPTDVNTLAYSLIKQRLMLEAYQQGLTASIEIGDHEFSGETNDFRDNIKNFVFSMIISSYVERNLEPKPRFKSVRKYEQQKMDMYLQANLDFSPRWDELTQDLASGPNVIADAAFTIVREQLDLEEVSIIQARHSR